MFKKFNDLKKSKKGFTLVELIVVLVILAILAAILVPTLLGYIDKARSEKDYSTAQTVRVAAQAAIDEAYGKSGSNVATFTPAMAAQALTLAGSKTVTVSNTDTDIKNVKTTIDGKAVDIESVDLGKGTEATGNVANNEIWKISVKIDTATYSYDATTNTWSAAK